MILEIASFLIINTNQIKEINVSHANNHHNINSRFILGDSTYQTGIRAEQERERAERENERLYRYGVGANMEVVAREKATQTSGGGVNKANPYVYGNCTYYVAKEKGITQIYGDARYWPVNSSVPAVGAVIVTYESWRGHVGIIREINGTQVKIEEMNYVGWGRVSTRVVDYRTIPVKGFLVI